MTTAEQEYPAIPGERKITKPQSKKLHALYRETGLDNRDDQLAFLTAEVGRDVTTSNELTAQEASIVIDVLAARSGTDAA